MATDDAPNLRRLARQLVDVTRRLKHLETVPQLAHSSLDDHGMPVYDADGNLTVTVGKQPDGTWGAKPVAGPVPPRPVGLDAEGDAGTIRASWQGVFWAGAALPMDFEAVQVLVDGSVYAAIHDPEGGSIQVPALPGERLVSFRTLSQAGVVSEAVAFGTVTVDPRVSEQMQELGENLAELRDVTLPELADELDDAASDLQQKLDAANARIDDIIVDGGGAGNFTTYSINEPSGEGTGEGDQWFRVVNGEVIGQWRWDGAAWVPVTLTDAIIAGIDLSKLVSNGNLSEVVANKMFTDIFTANKITSQEIAAGSITTEKIAAEGIVADVIHGGSFVGESFEGGTFTGGLFKTSDGLPGEVSFSDTGYIDTGSLTPYPGLQVIPLDTSTMATPPGIGPNSNGMIVSGGRDTSGGRAYAFLSPDQATLIRRSGYEMSAAGVGAGYSSMTVVDEAGTERARIQASAEQSFMRTHRADGGVGGAISSGGTFAQMTTTASSGARGVIYANPQSAYIRTVDANGTTTGRLHADATESYIYTRAGGSQRYLSVDADGVWVKTNKSGSWQWYNLEETAQDSGWKSFPVRSGITATSVAYRNKGGVAFFRGSINSTWAAGWNTVVSGLSAVQPSYEMRAVVPVGSTDNYLIRMLDTGAMQVYCPDAGSQPINLSSLSYPIG